MVCILLTSAQGKMTQDFSAGGPAWRECAVKGASLASAEAGRLQKRPVIFIQRVAVSDKVIGEAWLTEQSLGLGKLVRRFPLRHFATIRNKMLIGDPHRFAIESGITQAYERLSFRALGYFVLHIGGLPYGVRKPDATMMACSWETVQERLAEQGKHQAAFTAHPHAGEIADAFTLAVYAPDQEDKYFFGLSQPDFYQFIHNQKLVWAPDGEEAFADGSFVLQFDVGNRVRLIAFKTSSDYHHDPATLRDAWLDAEKFYKILKDWLSAFEAERQATSMISERDDGVEK